jgi:hypothetical protein
MERRVPLLPLERTLRARRGRSEWTLVRCSDGSLAVMYRNTQYLYKVGGMVSRGPRDKGGYPSLQKDGVRRCESSPCLLLLFEASHLARSNALLENGWLNAVELQGCSTRLQHLELGPLFSFKIAGRPPPPLALLPLLALAFALVSSPPTRTSQGQSQDYNPACFNLDYSPTSFGRSCRLRPLRRSHFQLEALPSPTMVVSPLPTEPISPSRSSSRAFLPFASTPSSSATGSSGRSRSSIRLGGIWRRGSSEGMLPSPGTRRDD